DISGSSTGLALIAAETFGVPVERVQVEIADTASAPQGPVAGGSITTGTVGPAVAAAAADARRQLFEIAAEKLEAAAEDLEIHGGAVQGLGRAMGEQLHYEAGQLRTGSFLDYELPTADQIPEIDVQVLEIPASTGIGTRGVGEPPAVPGPAALANAIASATGVRVRELPIAAQLLIG